MKKLLEKRNEQKAKKPTFLRQDAHKVKRVPSNWRQPKGKDSKMRKKQGGKRRMPSMGFSSPRKVRGLDKLGFVEVLVKNVNELNSIDPKTQIVVLGRIGTRKRVEVLKKCDEMKLKVTNVKDIKAYLAEVDKKIAEKKKKLKELEEKKVKRDKETEKKDKKPAKKEEVKDEAPKEETKKGSKSDKIKVLEKGE
tara:strand:+ start:889 stop:1470 length:582 start_codon:yes stop_codon:yes gene_type:complete